MLAVLLLVLLLLFGVGGDADDAGGNFVVDYGLVVFTYNMVERLVKI